MTLTELCAVGALVTTIVLLLLQLGRRSAGWDRTTVNGHPSLGELERRVKDLEQTRVRREICDERHQRESGE